MTKTNPTHCREVLIASLLLVFSGWLIQFTFHQTWLCIYGSISWKNGFYLSILMSSTPLIYCVFLLWKKPVLPSLELNYRDGLIIMVLLFLSIIFWCFFSLDAAYYPVHTYGDESFHTDRVQIMANDIQTWIKYFTHHTPQPEYRAEYMMYPSLTYVPVTLWTTLFGDVGSITDQRMFLVVSYLAVVLTTYLFARRIIKSKLVCSLITLLPLSSPLLLSYTMSFYIEFQYVSILIFAFWFLALGTEKHSKEIVMTAVFVSSLAPIMRESAIAGTLGIVFSAIVWHCVTLNPGKRPILRVLPTLSYLPAGLLPFIMYYSAKSHYTNWDKSRTSLTFLLHQDYWPLLKYSFLYLSPIAILALLFFMLRPMQAKGHIYVLLAAISGITAGVVMQSIFLPGYMPWTRNYLFYYAEFIVLIILCINSISKIGPKSKAGILTIQTLSLVTNIVLTTTHLKNNTLFHESEVVFDFRPINKYLTEYREQFNNQIIYVYWPKNFPTYPMKLLPEYVKLTKVPSPKAAPLFLPFEHIRAELHKEVHYLLFYYLKNDSKPRAFNSIPAAERPNLLQWPNYHILAESVDPWSQGRNGVMLLERREGAN